MEFFALLLLLYGLQCLHPVPRGATLFVRPLGRWVAWEGPGWRVEGLRPGSLGYVGEGLPWRVRGEALRWRGIEPRFLRTGLRAREPEVDPGAPAEMDGAVLSVAGTPVLRCASERSARDLGERIERGAGRDDGTGFAYSALLDGDTLAAFREAASRIEQGTRWLRIGLDANGAFLFVGLPLAAAAWGIEAALWRLGPVWLALHAVGVVAFARAHRRLFPGQGGALAVALVEVALYPPSLLRGAQKLAAEALGRRHPAVVALEVLPEAAGREFLRRALLRVDEGPGTGAGAGLEAAERRALEALAREAGLSPEALRAPPLRRDVQALAYCPLCLAEYRRAEGDCSDCGRALAGFASHADGEATGSQP